MMCLDTLSPFPLEPDERYLIVVLHPEAHVLDCLSLSETLQTEGLVETTAIYLSPNLGGDPPADTLLEHHYLKVFLKKGVPQEASLAFSQALKANSLIKEIHFSSDSSFLPTETLRKAELLRLHLTIQKQLYETEALLALLKKRGRRDQ